MSSPQGSPSYRVLLRTPQALRTFSAALAARLAYGIVFLSLLLTVSRATGSYTVAGGVLAMFGLSSSLLAPYRARMIDRYGPRRAMLPMALACAVLLGVIAAVAWQPGAPRPVLWVLGGASGACAPPVGPFMRTLWEKLVGGDEGLLQRAYSLDTVAEELLYVVGPLVAGLCMAFSAPAMGVLLSAVLLLTGTLALVATPAVRNFHGRPEPEAGPATPASEDRPEPGVKRRRRIWPGAGLQDPVIVTAGLGACLGSLNLLAVAFAGEHGGTASVAWVEAAMSVSSAFGGLLYGALRWRISTRARLPLLAATLGLFCALAGQAGNIVVLAFLAACVGFLTSPTLTTAYLAASETNTGGSGIEVGTWVNTAFNTGNSMGSAGIGIFLAPLSVAWCFVVAGGLVCIPAGVAGVRLLGARPRPKSSVEDTPVPAIVNLDEKG